ncbi:16855_t:CDS:1, partial [Dentiscutata heterogama]
MEFEILRVISEDKYCEKEFVNSKLKKKQKTVKQILSLNFWPEKLEEKSKFLTHNLVEKPLAHNLVYLLYDFDKESIKNKKQAAEQVNKAIEQLFSTYILNDPSILKTTTEKIIIRIEFKGYKSLRDLINDDNL